MAAPSIVLPHEAKVIIVGGGIVGCSVAYHLAKAGLKDVVLLEQGAIGGGTTWHAAGLVGRLRTTNSMTKINKYSAELYASLESETGHSVGWEQVGSLIVARSEQRMQQLHRTAAMSQWFGVEVQMIGPEQARERWPLIQVEDVLGAAWLPHDGKVIPKEVAVALHKGALMHGANFFENICVARVLHENGRACGIEIEGGHQIRAEYVILCGGMWTRQLALGCGVSVPLFPVEHHYVVTEPLAGASNSLPVGRDPDLCIYFRGEANGIMLGSFQQESKPWAVDPVPSDFSFKLLDPDWDKFSVPLANGRHRIPALRDCKFAKFVNGPESFTPDNNFIMGEAPEMMRLFVAAGFNSVGIASAGGAGRYLAEWIMEGAPSIDLWSVDIRRFAPFANTQSFLKQRVSEVLGLHYQMAWPNREFETGRGLRLSPLHDRLASKGACFGQKNGWERPNWFAVSDPSGKLAAAPVVEYSFEKQNWFNNHAAEHRAARESCAIFDQSGFSKYCVQGRDALAALQFMCSGNVDKVVGSIVYTAMLNERGGFEADVTVVRVAAEEFYVVSGTSTTVRDLDWMRRQCVAFPQVQVHNVTCQFGVLGVMGPNARALMQCVTNADVTGEGFAFGSSRIIEIGHVCVRAMRVTYVGELGWELHVAVEQTCAVYDALHTAAVSSGITLRDAGHYAINSLRLEKAYRAWGAELSPDDTPLEAGLGFAIDFDKGNFAGARALLLQKQRGISRRLVSFTLDDPQHTLWGSELIYRNGTPCGYTTSGSFGHSLGSAVALGYVANAAGQATLEFVRSGSYEISVNGVRVRASVHVRAPLDPDRARILA